MTEKNSRLSRTIRYLVHKLRLPRDKENVDITIENIRTSANLTGVNLWVLVAAILIASLGLNMNSTAVIIGAMLISPLMGPIIGFGLGLGINDFQLIKKSLRNFVIMVLMSVATSSTFFFVSPMKEAGSELLGRTSPTVYDVVIAFFGGLAGIIAGSSKLRSGNVVPGVAIATALMPPLCTMGYGISHLNWEYAAGAFYLFMINSVFIALATYLVVNLLRYPDVEDPEPGHRRKIHFIITLIVALMIAPSVYLTFHIVKKHFYIKNAEQFVNREIIDGEHIVITSRMDYRPRKKTLEVVVVGETFDSTMTAALKGKMRAYGLEDCELVLHQGGDTRAAARGMFDVLSTDMQVTRASIEDIYHAMDSMKKRLNRVTLPDSLQAQLARQIRTTDTTLQRLSLHRTLSFNPGKNNHDTLWRAVVSFSGGVSLGRIYELQEWMKTRLKSPYVRVELEQ